MAESRRIRCKVETCNWSIPSFYTKAGGRTASGWPAYADHLLNMDGDKGHERITEKQHLLISRGWLPGRAAVPAEDES